ncbi:MAG: hypothetical protein JWM95_51 [Gemmatimonadetes bacterium]|nr:hypothetical protein [Gemmatimonadota bacterium]
MVFARHDVDRRGGRVRRVPHGSAEATHRVWRDDPGVASYCSDGETGGKADEFAALFAWMVTSPTRAYVKDVREEDF